MNKLSLLYARCLETLGADRTSHKINLTLYYFKIASHHLIISNLWFDLIIFINCKWVDTQPVAVVISHITYARTMKVDYCRFSWGGLHVKHAVAT
jgi:hypothetical protein